MATAPPGDSVARGFIPEVEMLRGVAITLVYLLHLDAWVVFRAPGRVGHSVSPVAAFMYAGHSGVSLFFILSAFLLARPFLREAAGGRRVDCRTYFLRRVLRIMPLYVAVVVLATIVCAQRWADLLHGLPYLVFLNAGSGWATPLPPYSNVWWSLATEAQFYLLLPLLPLLTRSARGRWVGGLLLGTYVVLYVGVARGVLSLRTLDGELKLAHSAFGRGPFVCVGHLRGVAVRALGGAHSSMGVRQPAAAQRRR